MSKKVTVIDYGVGNLFSVRRAFEHCGAEVVLTDSPDVIAQADRLVLPGVGAFEDGMKGLRSRGLIEPVQSYAKNGRPFLGICLGMQMLLSVSEEFGEHEGLGLIPGRVTRIPDTTADGKPHKIPHIGWNALTHANAGERWDQTILGEIEPGASMYFVHSYGAEPENPGHRLADCLYGDRRVSAVVRSGNLYGCQFHPEKSGPIGLKILHGFLGLT
jgi:glutamine amidotransferase